MSYYIDYFYLFSRVWMLLKNEIIDNFTEKFINEVLNGEFRMNLLNKKLNVWTRKFHREIEFMVYSKVDNNSILLTGLATKILMKSLNHPSDLVKREYENLFKINFKSLIEAFNPNFFDYVDIAKNYELNLSEKEQFVNLFNIFLPEMENYIGSSNVTILRDILTFHDIVTKTVNQNQILDELFFSCNPVEEVSM